MSRDAGFPIADLDVGFLRDVKVRRLRSRIPERGSDATVLYLAVVLSSWEEGDRLAVHEADSPVPATPDLVDALHAAGLLDDDGKVPVHAWEGWFRPAWERREKKRSGGQRGNAIRWGSRSHSDSESDSDSVSPNRPIRTDPSEPSVRPDSATTDRSRDQRTTCPRCGDGPLDDKDPNVAVADRSGQLRHWKCPTVEAIPLLVEEERRRLKGLPQKGAA